MDPAALGTTIIGLEAIRARSDDRPPRGGRRSPRTSLVATIRTAVAMALRALADSLEPSPRQPAPVD